MPYGFIFRSYLLVCAKKALYRPSQPTFYCTYANPNRSVESVHTKNVVSILHLLVALARHFRAPVRLPENVTVDVVIVAKREGVLRHRVIAEEITACYDDLGMRQVREMNDLFGLNFFLKKPFSLVRPYLHE